ncbi:unnamed protein product [Dibothriocephalus latus]|uniref:Uncharacterized protein n=1 Tax=Dibothriocephalus latus TaxID=60516 RepID=A0A3P7NS50_DIBLA|nr:unnamed protein product [Dibothriocephalus latus]
MSPVQSQGKYYGGDKYDENDEDLLVVFLTSFPSYPTESIKLLLNDCHQRQSKLFSLSPLSSSDAAFVLSPLTKGELLYSSGQSRLHLHLRETELLTQPSADQILTSASDTTLDFVTFKMKVPESAKIPTFPSSLEREVSAFRSHGLPLLVWPRTRDKATLQKYLDDNYPDCARWFSELDRTLTWLEEKWVPLSAYLGLELPSEYSTSPKTKCLRGLSEDCMAFKLIKTRTTCYVNLLKSYLMHRRLATPGFHRNPIHHQLANLCTDRSNDLPNDSGFFNVVGNRLLQLGYAAEANGKSVELKIEEMAKTIEDSQKRAHL